MKKALCLILSVFLFCTLLPGCEEKPPEKLRVFVKREISDERLSEIVHTYYEKWSGF